MSRIVTSLGTSIPTRPLLTWAQETGDTLARPGHSVTIIGPSSVMREYSARRLKGEDPDVAARIRLVGGSGELASDVVGNRNSAAVLNNGVLPYTKNPGPIIASLYCLAASDGIVSIMAKGRPALSIMAADNGRWRELLDLCDADRVVNNLGVINRADTVEELGDVVGELGGRVEGWYGVTFFTQEDSTPRDAISDDEYEAIGAVDLEASQRDPFRQLSNMCHLVARHGSEMAGLTPGKAS